VDNPAGVSLLRTVDSTYAPGDTATVTVTIRATSGDNISAIGLTEYIPEGWSFVSASGPAIVPAAGAEDTLDFAWLSPPVFPYTFSYVLLVPRNGRGTVEIAGSIEYREDGGAYVTDEVASTIAGINPADVSLERSHSSAYTAGSEFTVTIGIDADDGAPITALGLAESIPEGWTYVSSASRGGGVPDVTPEVGSSGLIEFAWITIPEFPYTFTYTLAVPQEATGAAAITGYVAYRLDAGPLSTEDLMSSIAGMAP